jgi:hypothetical protein
VPVPARGSAAEPVLHDFLVETRDGVDPRVVVQHDPLAAAVVPDEDEALLVLAASRRLVELDLQACTPVPHRCSLSNAIPSADPTQARSLTPARPHDGGGRPGPVTSALRSALGRHDTQAVDLIAVCVVDLPAALLRPRRDRVISGRHGLRSAVQGVLDDATYLCKRPGSARASLTSTSSPQ